MALLPGATLAQYVGTRLAAHALATVGRFGVWMQGGSKGASGGAREEGYSIAADNSLGLHGIDAGPDMDREHAA